MKNKIVVIGAGHGIGKGVAEKFGSEGYHVILIARTVEILEEITQELEEKNISTQYFIADANDNDSIRDVFEQIWEEHQFIDTILYNVSKRKQVSIEQETADSLTKDFKTNVAAALTAIQLILPDMEKHNTGTILFTGGGLALQPNADYGSLSIGKAGLRSLAESLHIALKPMNIYVGTITICGYVQESDEKYNPAKIAELFWKLNTERTIFEIQY
jgi:short-subunit dehydrogenase